MNQLEDAATRGERGPLAQTIAALVAAYARQLNGGGSEANLDQVAALKSDLYAILTGIVTAATEPVKQCAGERREVALELCGIVLGEAAEALDKAGRDMYERAQQAQRVTYGRRRRREWDNRLRWN